MSRKQTKKTAEPMDNAAAESKTPTPAQNRRRPAYALKTLVDEVVELFPEVQYEFDGYDGRGTALSVDITVYGSPGLAELLTLVEGDLRVEKVTEEDGIVRVDLYSNPRIQDMRTSFGLDSAWEILGDMHEGSW